MAALINKTYHDDKTKNDWRFYVYDILDDDGNAIYVGKGSGNRIKVSERYRCGARSNEAARFFNEEDAYKYEIERIAEINPILNKHSGGNGSRCVVVAPIKTKIDPQIRLMNKIGTRSYAARMLIGYYKAFKYITSKVDGSTKHLLNYYTDDIINSLESIDIDKMIEVGYGTRA